MIEKPKEYSLEETGISYSLLSAFLVCPMQFLFMINEFSHPSIEKKVSFGNIVHKAFEDFYGLGECPDDEMITEYFMKKSEKYPEKSFEYSKAWPVVIKYFQSFYKDFYDRIISTEKVYEKKVKIKDTWITLRGKIDMKIIRNKFNINVEHKTRSQISEDMIEMLLRWDLQNFIYNLLEPCEFAIRNIIRNPGHTIKKDESLINFSNRIASEIDKDPTHFFKRFEIEYYESDKTSMMRSFEIMIENVSETLKRNRFYRNCEACSLPGRKCDYIDACLKGDFSGLVKKPLFSELKQDSEE